MASNSRSGFSPPASIEASSSSAPPAMQIRPWSAARFIPSDAASMPIIHLGSMYSLRSSLYMRSVPMLPDPTIAAVSFFFSVMHAVSPVRLQRHKRLCRSVELMRAGVTRDNRPGQFPAGW